MCFKQKTAYEIEYGLVGSEMCIRDRAMGVTRERAQGAVRLTLGATTTAADVDRGVEVLVQAVHQLRRSAPRQAS